jgi:beta-fructofuranosidase
MNPQEIELTHRVAIQLAGAAENLASGRVAADPLRQRYHLSPAAGWMNDPCACVYFGGGYHLMYQYDPFHIPPHSMYYGHAFSRDLAHWEALPVALAPSETHEMYAGEGTYGIFTGSAAADGETLNVLYCAASYQEDGSPRQTVCLAASRDGVHFEKYPGNPVIPAPPADGSPDFRDPKLWRHNGRWYALVGSSKDGLGEVLLYDSKDLIHWRYIGVAARSDGRFGCMWECPDFFELGGKQVLIFSPVGMVDADTVYMVGTLDDATGRFSMENWGRIDWGAEFYAPQTLEDPQGRRVMFGWCGMWEGPGHDRFRSYGPTIARGWYGHMSLPRILSLDTSLQLIQTPAPELVSLREGPCRSVECRLADEKRATRGFSCAAEYRLTLDFGDSEGGAAGIALRISADGSRKTVLRYDVREQILSLDRSRSDAFSGEIQAYLVPLRDGRVELCIFTDTTSIELFADGGRIAASNNLYPDPEDTGVELFAEGCCSFLLEGWNLRP